MFNRLKSRCTALDPIFDELLRTKIQTLLQTFVARWSSVAKAQLHDHNIKSLSFKIAWVEKEKTRLLVDSFQLWLMLLEESKVIKERQILRDELRCTARSYLSSLRNGRKEFKAKTNSLTYFRK
mmetsp:Transcript_37866/g.119657  ORF Transcript_37866/g.119657 Transcript_37866/m.119657 type:complete len:124 (-) Transcript_37866:26-397(-)